MEIIKTSIDDIDNCPVNSKMRYCVLTLIKENNDKINKYYLHASDSSLVFI